MAEKITLKNMLANLPQKTDVDSIVATDASGNPVYIKKADLAQVVAELIGGANSTLNAKTLGMRPLSFFYKRITIIDSENWDSIIGDSLFLHYTVDVQGNNPYKIIGGGNQSFVFNFIVAATYGCQIAFTWGQNANRFARRVIITENGESKWGDWERME